MSARTTTPPTSRRGRRPGPPRPAPRLRGTRLPGPAVDLQPGQPLLHPRRLDCEHRQRTAVGVADRRRRPRPPQPPSPCAPLAQLAEQCLLRQRFGVRVPGGAPHHPRSHVMLSRSSLHSGELGHVWAHTGKTTMGLDDEATSTSCWRSATHSAATTWRAGHAQAAEPGAAMTRMPRPISVSRTTPRTDPPSTEGASAMSLARVQFFSISLDGFGTGEGQSHDAPFGHAGERLHEDVRHPVVARDGRPARRDRRHRRRFLAAARCWDGRRDHGCREVRPARMARGPGVEGLVGPNPPFHTGLRPHHHPRPSIEMEGGTTFHFIDASPAEALETARKAAGGRDVRIGGVPPRSATSLLPGSSTTCTSWWSRSCSAGASACGTDWRASKVYEVEATSSPS